MREVTCDPLMACCSWSRSMVLACGTARGAGWQGETAAGRFVYCAKSISNGVELRFGPFLVCKANHYAQDTGHTREET